MIQPRFISDDGSVTLYCADCLEVLPTLSGIDAVVADPPYGMNNDADSNRFMPKGKRQKPCRAHQNIVGDDSPFDPSPFIGFPRVVLWGYNHYARNLQVGTTLVWLKRHPEVYGQFLSDAEIAWMKGGCGIYCFYKLFPPPVKAIETGGDPCRPTTPHPNIKPISLMAWCMDMSKVPTESSVLDPYMGSGTTGIACIRTGRRFIGIEIDPKYYQIAEDRIKRELAQGKLNL